MYTFFLHLHSGLRWIALALAIITVLKSLAGLFSKSGYGKLDNILAASYVGTIHLQVLVGIILYAFLSPITQAAFSDFGGAMKNAEMRFWAVEHITVMILVAVFAQIGRSKSKKKSEAGQKFKLQTIFFLISLLLMLWGIPWGRL